MDLSFRGRYSVCLKDQILNCKVEGTWDISDSTNTKLSIYNGYNIQQLFQ